jgi:phosphoribosylformylglycinamidine synthase
MLEELIGAKTNELLGANVPSPSFADVLKEIHCVHEGIENGLILSCHDISEGGLLLALFEMTLPQRRKGGNIGIEIDLTAIAPGLGNDKVCYSETGGFVVEVSSSKLKEFETLASKNSVPLFRLGTTSKNEMMTIARHKETILDAKLSDLRTGWANALQTAMHSS